jgi:hypothetical protein
LASYQAISVTSQAILGLLSDAWLRDEFPNARFELYEANDFNAPMEEGLSLYLYRVATNMTRRNLPSRRSADGRRYRLPLPVDLSYVLTPWAKTAAQQHRLLGWAMRTLEDTPILPAGYLNSYGAQVETFHPDETVELVPEPLSLQDVNNIWNGFKPNMYPSVAYVARLVVIESSVPLTDSGLVQTREFDLVKAIAK